jgi:hypothetical protein
MKYLLMIYDDEIARHSLAEPERNELTGRYMTLVKELVDKGIYLGGAPLEPTSTAQSVRVRDGKVQLVDGPFAETREQLGGYFLIEASSLAEATAIAARIPASSVGTIEVRALANHE